MRISVEETSTTEYSKKAWHGKAELQVQQPNEKTELHINFIYSMTA